MFYIVYFRFLEPDFDYMDALAPYQPLQMKAAHCTIDTSLNFTQANKLIKDLKPAALVVPECYIKVSFFVPYVTQKRLKRLRVAR